MLPEAVGNQLHSDRQTFSNTDRNIQAGEAERRHRHEWTLLTNQAPHAFRTEQILSPTEWKLARLGMRMSGYRLRNMFRSRRMASRCLSALTYPVTSNAGAEHRKSCTEEEIIGSLVAATAANMPVPASVLAMKSQSSAA